MTKLKYEQIENRLYLYSGIESFGVEIRPYRTAGTNQATATKEETTYIVDANDGFERGQFKLDLIVGLKQAKLRGVQMLNELTTKYLQRTVFKQKKGA